MTQEMQLNLCRHRVVVFRDQGVITGQRQVEISEWFGPCESTFYKHPKSPHPDIFRVSNNNLEGCTGQHYASVLPHQVCHCQQTMWCYGNLIRVFTEATDHSPLNVDLDPPNLKLFHSLHARAAPLPLLIFQLVLRCTSHIPCIS